jgi:tRNA threonylcarbamoyladenosine biosynthesis protein TsaB
LALLFIDSTYDLNLGLLSDDFTWIEQRLGTGQRASAILQSETHALCHAHGVRPQSLKAVITVAGPGFYTGLRVSEGFADILKVFGVPCHSFFSYEIPRWCSFEKGVWMTKAYRGEYFFHEWDKGTSSNTLIPTKELPQYLKRFDHMFIHSLPAIDYELTDFTSTIDLLNTKSQMIVPEILKSKLVRESFYFRAPEDEFRVSV